MITTQKQESKALKNTNIRKKDIGDPRSKQKIKASFLLLDGSRYLSGCLGHGDYLCVSKVSLAS